MSAISTISRVASPPPWLPLHRFTSEQFHQLAESGILAPDDAVEFHDGLIVVCNNGNLLPMRFTVEQYQRMITLGIVPEDTPVELLDGWIVTKMARNAPHDTAVYFTQMGLIRRLPADWICRCQSGMTTDTSQPEPDVAVVQGPPQRYRRRQPTAQDTALAIEISDTTLARDRDFKGPLYAQARIPIYWIVNIPDNWIEVYTEPAETESESAYGRRQDYHVGDSVPLIVAGNEIASIPVLEILTPDDQP